MLLDAATLFERVDEDEHHVNQNLFEESLQRRGYYRRSSIGSKDEDRGVEVPRSDLRFESKAQSHHSYDAWMRKILALP